MRWKNLHMCNIQGTSVLDSVLQHRPFLLHHQSEHNKTLYLKCSVKLHKKTIQGKRQYSF